MQNPVTKLHTTELISVYIHKHHSRTIHISILVDKMNLSYDSGDNIWAVELLLSSLSSEAAYRPLFVSVGQYQEYILSFSYDILIWQDELKLWFRWLYASSWIIAEWFVSNWGT